MLAHSQAWCAHSQVWEPRWRPATRWDGLGTIAIGVLLITIAAILAVEMKSHLIGESADSETHELIRATIADHPDVAQILMLRTLHLGPDDLLVAAKVDLHGPRDPTDSINEIELRLRAAVPTASMILIEPDHFRPDYGTPISLS